MGYHNELKEADLAIFASAIEGEVSREMGLFDSKNQPFNEWLGTHSRRLQKATKKSA